MQRGDAAQVLGIALAIKMIAYIGVAPIASAFAERLPRKQVLVGLDVIRALTYIVSTVCDANLANLYSHFYFAICFCCIYTNISGNDSRCSLKKKDYTNALSLSRLAYDLENIISPMLAGFLLTVMSYHNLF